MDPPPAKRSTRSSASLADVRSHTAVAQQQRTKVNHHQLLPQQTLLLPGTIIEKSKKRPAVDTIWHAIDRNDLVAVSEFIEQGQAHLLLTQTMHEEQHTNGKIVTRTVVKPETEHVTPLMYAASRGRLDIVKKLLASGADPNAQNAQGHTALTSCNTHTSVMKALLNAGADPNIKAFWGHTALMYALMRRDLKQTLLLLNHGADPDITTTQGYTTRWYAIEAGDRFIHAISTYMILVQAKIKKTASVSANIKQGD